MELIYNEEMIRAELKRLDDKTGFHAADLPIKFGMAKGTLGRFSYPSADKLKFYFSNYYFQNPNHPVEEKLNTIRHEYAHYLDYMLTGSSSHGPSWRKCCAIVGAYPTRCFNQRRANTFLAKHKKERLQNERFNEYVVGLDIVHPTFGDGRIVDVAGEGPGRIAHVSFDSAGTKRIAVSWIDSNCQKRSGMPRADLKIS